MPNPRQKLSRNWKRTRRSHDAIKMGALSSCQRCGQPKLPHRVCANCGHYSKDKMVVDMKKL